MAIHAGDISGRREVSRFIDIVRQLLDGNRTVQLVVEGRGGEIKLTDSVTAVLPESVTITASGTRKGVVLTVGRPYVQAKYSVAKGNIDAVTVTPDRIEFSLRGLPDVYARVTE